MSERPKYVDPFLANLSSASQKEIDKRRRAWGKSRKRFYRKLDRWFSNFEEKDKPLALKILLNIQYYTKRQMEERIEQLRAPLARYLYETERTMENVRLIVPNERADSADLWAYNLTKIWGLRRRQVVRVQDLDELDKGQVFIFFNDTHGTGNQFVREHLEVVQKQLQKRAQKREQKHKQRQKQEQKHKQEQSTKPESSRLESAEAMTAEAERAEPVGLGDIELFIMSISIAQGALKRFKKEAPHAHLVPNRSSPSALDLFTAADFKRIRELGMQVYPPHPIGFGDAAMLTAYHYQCPNNTLPLIWADGKNNEAGGSAFPWRPLFRYRPKKSLAVAGAESTPEATDAPRKSVAPLVRHTDKLQSANLVWTPEELDQIEERLRSWGLTEKENYERAGLWFRNFGPSPEERALALAVFLNTRYLSMAKVRKGIRQLRQQVLRDILNAGGDLSDVMLVTTGEKQDSVYHYVYDFLVEWGLSTEQVCSIRQLNKKSVIDKTLVLFYHTRTAAKHFREKQYVKPVIDSAPRATFIAAYAMPQRARAEFRQLFADAVKFAYLEEESKTAQELLPQQLVASMTAISAQLSGGGRERQSVLEDLLLAYYFQCPRDASPLLYRDQTEPRQWVHLFRHHKALTAHDT